MNWTPAHYKSVLSERWAPCASHRFALGYELDSGAYKAFFQNAGRLVHHSALHCDI